MPNFDPTNPLGFFNSVRELLLARQKHHEYSIVKEATKYIELADEYEDWGKTHYNYKVILELTVREYSLINDRVKSSSVIQKTCNEVVQQYGDVYISQVLISIRHDEVVREISDYDKALKLKQLIIDRAAAFKSIDADKKLYARFRSYFTESIKFRNCIPEIVSKCDNLDMVHNFLFDIYDFELDSDKILNHVEANFSELISLSEYMNNPIDLGMSEVAELVGYNHVCDVWHKALMRRFDDPEAAITSSRTLLETVCKHILEEYDVDSVDSFDLPNLYRNVASLMNLAPEQHNENVFKQILGGCFSIINGIANVRNALGDAHGKAKKASRPAERHAELAVNLAGVVSIFLIRTVEKRRISKKQT